MLIIEFYDDDYGFLMMYDLINDILIVFEKKKNYFVIWIF